MHLTFYNLQVVDLLSEKRQGIIFRRQLRRVRRQGDDASSYGTYGFSLYLDQGRIQHVRFCKM